MSNISTYPSYSADCMCSKPVVHHAPPFSVNSSMYPMILQILAQLRTPQSECNVRKPLITVFQIFLQREQQLRSQDNLQFHFKIQQLLTQIDAVHSQLEMATETLHRETGQLKQKISICKVANLQAEIRMRELEYLCNGTSLLKENVLNLTNELEKKDQILELNMEETKRIKENLHDTLQIIKGKNAQLEDIRDERNILKKSVELTKQAIEDLKAQKRENQTILVQILNLTQINNLKQAQLNEDYILQWNKCCNSLTYLKNKSEEEKHEIGEILNKFKTEFNKFIVQEGENTTSALVENLITMAVSMVDQTQLNKKLITQKDDIRNSLEDLKNKWECKKREMNEELMKLKDEIMKLKAENRKTQQDIDCVLKQNLNLKNNITKQVQLIKELQEQGKKLQVSLADLKNKSEAELRLIKEEMRSCNETKNPIFDGCGPTRLKQIKLPEPERELNWYRTYIHKHLPIGSVIQVIGSFQSTGDKPWIYLKSPSSIPLALYFGFNCSKIIRNTLNNYIWGVEETCGGMPVKRGQHFNITFTLAYKTFQICVNGVMFATYKHRMEPNLINGVITFGFDLKNILYFTPAYTYIDPR